MDKENLISNLIKNSKSALIASIEIYNEPSFLYREETFTILLINSWELLFKAILLKNNLNLFYKEDLSRSLSLSDAKKECGKFFPKFIKFEPISRNIDLFQEYRDKTIHFYNEEGLSLIIYSLAKTNLSNYRKILKFFFEIEITDEITIEILPLSFQNPINPIEFLKNNKEGSTNPYITDFITNLANSVDFLDSNGFDTSGLCMFYSIKLESNKKIEKADFVAGVVNLEDKSLTSVPIFLQKPVDPNLTYPYHTKQIIEKFNISSRFSINSFDFQAILWKYRLKRIRNFAGLIICRNVLIILPR